MLVNISTKSLHMCCTTQVDHIVQQHPYCSVHNTILILTTWLELIDIIYIQKNTRTHNRTHMTTNGTKYGNCSQWCGLDQINIIPVVTNRRIPDRESAAVLLE